MAVDGAPRADAPRDRARLERGRTGGITIAAGRRSISCAWPTPIARAAAGEACLQICAFTDLHESPVA